MSKTPDALLLIATGCSHCPAMLEHLSSLVKNGRLARLEVINISQQPEPAQILGVRTVPWTRIGDFHFSGVIERRWLGSFIDAVRQGQGHTAYLAHLLEHRQLGQAVAHIRQRPSLLSDLLPLLGDLQQPMALRIGIGALIEELAEQGLDEYACRALQQLTYSPSPQVRADACHYLGVAKDHSALDRIQQLLEDDDLEVREIAAETLAVLHDPD